MEGALSRPFHAPSGLFSFAVFSCVYKHYRLDFCEKRMDEQPDDQQDDRTPFPTPHELQVALEQISNMIVVTDPEGTITYVNPAFTRLSGYTPEEAIGQNPRILKSDVQPKEYYEELWRIISSGETWSGEFCNTRKDGSIFWVRMTITPIANAEGTITDYVGVSEDITAAKEIEQQLIESERLFRLIAENTSDGILVLDSTGTVEYASPAYDRQRGRNIAESHGLTPDDIFALIHPDDREELFARVYTAINEKRESLTYTYRARGIDNDWRWFEDQTSFVYDQDDNHIKSYVLSRDITDRKVAEELLRSSIAENSSLLRELHHRVKNNLSIVRSLLSLQIESIETMEDAKKALTESRNRIHSMAEIHENVYLGSSLSHIDMPNYIDGLVYRLRQEYQALSVRIVTEVEPVFLDVEIAVPVGMVLNELITNAFDHAFAGRQDPMILVSLAHAQGNRITLVVRDNWVGLPKGFSIDGSTSLGMHLVSLLCRQIDAEYSTSNGSGAEFRISWRDRSEPIGP